jgi:hypothetical protein
MDQRHGQPDSGVGCTPDHRGISLGWQRKTRNLRRCIECSRASKVPTIDLFKSDFTMVANSRGQHTLKEILSVWRRRSARQWESDYTHRSATIGGTGKRYRPDHRDDRLEMTKAP